MLQHDVNIGYLKGKENVIADALSRISPLHVTNQDVHQKDIIPVHMFITEIPANSTYLSEFRKGTAEDATSGLLMKAIMNWLARIKVELSFSSTRLLDLQRRDQCGEWTTLQGTQTHHS